MKNKLPHVPTFNKLSGVCADVSPRALERWVPELAPHAATDSQSISIFDAIGADPWTGEGTSAKRVAAALRSIGANNPVTVYVNSPGGDMFEGMAIYSLLREHPAEVTVKVLGLAASAASLVAMAGDRVEIARSGFLMIHNAWVAAVGNRHDLREYADTLEPFDAAMADIYAARTGGDPRKLAKLMDGETWIGGADAVAQGFADDLLPADAVGTDTNARADVFAARKLDIALARAGMPRSERRELLQKFKAGTPRATGSETAGADEKPADVGTQNAAESLAVKQVLDLTSEIKGLLT